MLCMRSPILLLKKIPRGKVTTYGELAKACNTSPRAVGAIMRSNKRPEIYPCYKVVMADGSLGGYCGSMNNKKKISLLRKNGIVIKNGKIDLKKYLYKF